MIGILRKYQQGLWWIVAGVVGSSLLVFFNPGQSGSRDRGTGNYGSLYGRPLKPDQLREANRQARLAAIVRFGGEDTPEARRAGFNLQQETYQRLLLKEKIKELGIRVDDAAVAAWIRENLKDPKTGTINYTAFVDRNLRPRDYSATEFEEYVRQDLSLQHLIEVVGVSSELVTPREAEREFRHENEQAIATLILFSSSNHVAEVQSDPANLRQFYTNNLGEYRIPERSVVAYVRWEGSNYLATAEAEMAKVPNLSSRLEQFYAEKGPDGFRDEKGGTLTKEAAIAQIRQQAVQGEANKAAQSAARDFANELYQMELKAENLANLATKKGLHFSESLPFSANSVAPGLEDVPGLGREVAKLTVDQPFSTPLAGSRGAVVVALLRRLAPEIPAFETLEGRVRDDYVRFTAREAARNEGATVAAALTNAVAQGKNIVEFVQDQKLRTIELPPFSIASDSVPGLPPSVNFNQVKDTAFSLQPGKSSRFVATMDGGMVVFLKTLKPVSEEMVKAGLNSFIEEVRHRRRQEVVEAWIRHEFEASGLAAILKGQGTL